MDHGLFQAREIQREHREYPADLADGRAGIPEGSREGVEPGGMAEGLGEKFQPLDARLLLPVFDGYRSVHSQQFFGGHAGVADKDQAGLRVAPSADGPVAGPFVQLRINDVNAVHFFLLCLLLLRHRCFCYS